MPATTVRTKGRVTYDSYFGHVCTCTETVGHGECEGHPAGPFDPMGQTVYCDGTCNPTESTYEQTVSADRDSGTETGSYWYFCSRCGAGAWSGC